MSKSRQINLRLDNEIVQNLEKIADAEALRRTDLIRKYLIEGVRRWKLENAIQRYQRGQNTLERAALDAGISLYEIMEQLRSRNMPLDQTKPEEIRESIEALVAAAKV